MEWRGVEEWRQGEGKVGEEKRGAEAKRERVRKD